MAEQKVSSQTFSIREALRAGWELTRDNFWLIFAVLVIPQVISWLIASSNQPFMDSENGIFNLVGLLIRVSSLVLGLEFGYAMFAIFFKLTDKKYADIKHLYAYFDFRLLLRYFLVSVLYGLIVTAGFLLFIIPGIYFSIKYWFAIYICVDKHTGILQSFKESAKITDGEKWQLFKLGALQILIIFAGALALFIGLFIAIPVNNLSDIYVYRKLAAKHE